MFVERRGPGRQTQFSRDMSRSGRWRALSVPVVKSRAVASNGRSRRHYARTFCNSQKRNAYRLTLMSIHGGKLRWPTRSPRQRWSLDHRRAWRAACLRAPREGADRVIRGPHRRAIAAIGHVQRFIVRPSRPSISRNGTRGRRTGIGTAPIFQTGTPKTRLISAMSCPPSVPKARLRCMKCAGSWGFLGSPTA